MKAITLHKTLWLRFLGSRSARPARAILSGGQNRARSRHSAYAFR